MDSINKYNPRRYFLKQAALLSGTAFFPGEVLRLSHVYAPRLLSAYYFRAHMYTLVPHQIREDMQRMADVGTNAVAVAILEQDLYAAVENVTLIAQEAERVGMKLFVVPSRWGGLFAGAPKVPSVFSVQHPQTWVLDRQGKPVHSSVSGVISSVHYPETFDFCCGAIEKMMKLWPVAGIIWDEPKSYRLDYSPSAVKNLGAEASLEDHVQAAVDFHGRLNAFIKSNWPDTVTNLFTYANISDTILPIVSKTAHLDYFGCDGRPWHQDDGGKQESGGKTLLGNGERFLDAAQRTGVGSLWLIENHNMAAEDMDLAKKRLPQVVSQPVDHLIYYYFPRNLSNPDENMEAIFQSIQTFK